jgi:hypothetical protein
MNEIDWLVTPQAEKVNWGVVEQAAQAVRPK